MTHDEALEAAARAIYEANPMQRTWSRFVGETGSSLHHENIPWAEIVEDGNLPLYTEMARAAIEAYLSQRAADGWRMMPREPSDEMLVAVFKAAAESGKPRDRMALDKYWTAMFDAGAKP